MWGTIETFLDETVVPDQVDGADLAAGYKCLGRFGQLVNSMTGVFDAGGSYDADLALTCAAWLREHVPMTPNGAQRTVARARRLRQLPVLAALAASGELSEAHVDIVLAHVTAKTFDLFTEHHAELVPTFVALSLGDTTAAMREWRTKAEALTDDSDERDHSRKLVLARLMHGRLDLRGHTDDPEAAAVIETALELADSGDYEQLAGERRMDALETVCRFYLDHHPGNPRRRHRPHLNLIVDATTDTATTLDGVRLPDRSLRTLLCDAAIRRITTAGSTILDYGQQTRTIPPPLWQATAIRDRGCRFPGCNRPTSGCDAHHVIPFPRGDTAPDNLVMLCSRHHHTVHKPGWHTKLHPDGTYEITNPRGTTRASRPPAQTRE